MGERILIKEEEWRQNLDYYLCYMLGCQMLNDEEETLMTRAMEGIKRMMSEHENLSGGNK